MLAPREFMSPEQLGITLRVYAALHELKGLFEQGVMVHYRWYGKEQCVPPHKRLFNMEQWNCDSSCGSICCLGGWTEILAGLQIGALQGSFIGDLPELRELFYPGTRDDAGGSYDKITTEQAYIALCNYLREGKARWDEVLPEEFAPEKRQ